MPRFFVPPEQIRDDRVEIVGDDAFHIARALRMAAGEKIVVADMRGGAYECVLETFEAGRVTARVVAHHSVSAEPAGRIVLYQAFPKGDKFDLIVQKSVELGVCDIVPFESGRCVSKPDRQSVEKKLARWRRISLEAAKQCGRGIVPEVACPLDFDAMLAEAAKADLPLFCYEGDDTEPLPRVLSRYRQGRGEAAQAPAVSIVVGPEGGFSLSEAQKARQAGLCLVGLGKRILRCETASAFVLACIAYEFEI